MDAAILLKLMERAQALNAALEYRDVLIKSEVSDTDQQMRMSTLQAIQDSRQLLWAVDELLIVAGVKS
jgi:hypothetical protein